MKNLTYVLAFLLLSVFQMQAQETINQEKTWAYSKNKSIKMNLKFGGSIIVKSWNKNEVKLKTILKTNDKENEKYHVMDVDDSNDELSIVTTYKFEKEKKYNQWDCGCNNNCFCLKVDYEVYVPADANLEVKTISGNIEVTGLKGKLRAKTISGNIEVTGLKGKLRAKTISGFVDATIPQNLKANIKCKSVTGEIYSDVDGVELTENSNEYSKKVDTALNGGGKTFSLSSVSGDIYLRKK
jgi:DUF4097 and DUF4098 domain-containing protein YvlB